MSKVIADKKQIELFGGARVKPLSEGSIKTYTSKLKKLNDDKTITDLKFLKDTEAILAKINKVENPNTRRSFFIAVVSVLKDNKKYAKEYDIYHKNMMDINGVLNKESFKSEKTKEKQTKVNMEELHKNYDELKQVITEIGKKRKVTEEQYERLRQLMIQSLYLLISPRRLIDYTLMLVEKPTEDKQFNYYYDGKFYFNNYKTKDAFKQQIIDTPQDLQDIIKIWTKFKKEGNNYLIVKKSGEPYNPTELTNDMKLIFNNPSMGVSVLRNVYLSSKYGNAMKDLKKDTADMGTSVGTAFGTYISKE
jgi:hypothetical protein